MENKQILLNTSLVPHTYYCIYSIIGYIVLTGNTKVESSKMILLCSSNSVVESEIEMSTNLPCVVMTVIVMRIAI